MKTIEKLRTENGKSYWDGNGAYQKDYNRLWEELVPISGDANTVHGEMIRAVGRLFYEYCNNGNCNARECDYYMEEYTCWECNGDGEIYSHDDDDGNEVYEECGNCYGCGYEEEETKGDPEIDSYYEGLITFLETNMTNPKYVTEVEDFLLRTDIGYGSYTFGDDEMKVYNDLVDEVMYQVLTTENKEYDLY